MIDARALDDLDQAVSIEDPTTRRTAVRAWKSRWIDAAWIDYAVDSDAMIRLPDAAARVLARAKEKLGRAIAEKDGVYREVETVKDGTLWCRSHVLVLRATPK